MFAAKVAEKKGGSVEFSKFAEFLKQAPTKNQNDLNGNPTKVGIYIGFEMQKSGNDPNSAREAADAKHELEATRLWAAFTESVTVEAIQCVYSFYFRLHWTFLPHIEEAIENRFDHFWRISSK